MVGANALLGEVLRVDLPDLARKNEGWKLAGSVEAYPSKHRDDPLSEHDDPATDANAGVLARDGGHFEAQFERGADAFADAAAARLRQVLPGLRFRISIDGEERTKRQTDVSTELPVLAPCQWTGRGLASAIISQGEKERPAVSLDVKRRHDAAEGVEKGSAKDMVTLLRAKTTLDKVPLPRDLDRLAGSGYLALIHADGNGVGVNRPREEAASARFFHRNRVFLRRATVAAINGVCNGDETYASLVPLMLGGDDLLVVCRADKALPFVVELCDELASAQRKDPSDFELTLGVGVVIAKPNIPIHRLHDVAEQLASSAKRRFRGLKKGEKPRSVVDWAVYGTTWVEDPDEVRRRDWLRGPKDNRRVLSQRPLDVLGEGLDSLQGLMKAVKRFEANEGREKVPRSQLRYLVEQLSRGRALTELSFAELSSDAREALETAGIRQEKIWRRAVDGGSSVTELLDLVEIFEIPKLGTKEENETRKEEAAHG